MILYDIIKKPLITEKTHQIREKSNQVVFVIDPMANKIMVKECVEKVFKVSVLKVTIVNVKSKKKRLGRHVGRSSSWKKAFLTLKEGDQIEYFQGA